MIAANLKKAFVVGGLLVMIAIPSAGQSGTSPTFNTSEGDILLPTTTGNLSQKDADALSEVLNHKNAVGTDRWNGMQGKGQITYGPDDSVAYDATLTNLDGDKFRLDAQTKKGSMSLRIDRRIGKIQYSDGTSSSLPLETAMAGLFPFEPLRLAHFPGATVSLFDHGLVAIDGVKLHRITFECPTLGRNPGNHLLATMAIDLYFDPGSHLLMKSVANVPVEEGRRVTFPFVVTYSDYRKVGNVMVPFRYSETMAGRQYLTLQLSSVLLNPAVDPTYFEF